MHCLRDVHWTDPFHRTNQQRHAQAHDGPEGEDAEQDDSQGHVQGPALRSVVQFHLPRGR